MAVTEADTTHLEPATEIDLAALGCPVPSGTTAEVTIRGSPASFVAELERNHRWVVEGSTASAELTAVYGGGEETALPAAVPEWIRRALEAIVDVREVTVRV